MRRRSGLWHTGSRQAGKHSSQKRTYGSYGRNGFGNDFNNKSDERFQEILPWIREVRRTMSKAEIKAKRHEVADSSSMPPYIKQLASRKGYCVKKCSTRKHPLRVSGYAIFKNERDKQPKYGRKFNLTVQQVKEILEAKEDK